MNKLLLVIMLFLFGCATVEPVQPPSPQKLIARFCPLIQSINQQIALFPNVDESVISDLDKLRPIVSAVCSANAELNIDNLNTLANTGMPILLTIITKSAIASTPEGNVILISLNLAQLLLPQIIAAMPHDIQQ